MQKLKARINGYDRDIYLDPKQISHMISLREGMTEVYLHGKSILIPQDMDQLYLHFTSQLAE